MQIERIPFPPIGSNMYVVTQGRDAAVLMDRTVPFLRALPPALTLYPGHGRCGMSLGEGLGSMDW